MKHDLSTYNNKGCRCDICRAANRAASAAFRERHASEPVPDHVHGTENGYCNYRCSCERCRRAHTDAERIRKRLRAAG